jgi:hypothetical protein
MFREGEIGAVTARASARVASLRQRSSVHAPLAAVFVSSTRASRAIVPLLLAEAAAFALVSASGKIPAFLFTAVRVLLTF